MPLLAQQSGSQQSGPAPKLREVPDQTARYKALTERNADAVQAMVQFNSTLPDGRVRSLLSKNDVRPYAVLMYLDGRYGTHAVDPERASLDLIEAARATSVTMREAGARSLKHRAEALLSEGIESRRALAEVLPELEEQRKSSLAALKGSGPIVYALKVVGSEASLKALAAESGVSKVEPGVIAANGRVAVPNPVSPPPKQEAAKARKSDAEVLTGLKTLAQ